MNNCILTGEQYTMSEAKLSQSERVQERSNMLESIHNEVDALLEITSENLDSESLKHVKIFSVVQRMYSREFKKLDRLTAAFDITKSRLKKYYGGKASEEEYRVKPMRVSPLKSEIDEFVKVDEEYVLAKLELQIQERIVKFLEETKKAISERTYTIKYAIDFRRMQQGTQYENDSYCSMDYYHSRMQLGCNKFL